MFFFPRENQKNPWTDLFALFQVFFTGRKKISRVLFLKISRVVQNFQGYFFRFFHGLKFIFHGLKMRNFHGLDIFSQVRNSFSCSGYFIMCQFFSPKWTSQFENRTGDNLKTRSCPWWKNCDGALLDFVYQFCLDFYTGTCLFHGFNLIFFSRLELCLSRVGFCWNFSQKKIMFHGLFHRFFHGKDQVFTGWKLIFFTGYKTNFTGNKKHWCVVVGRFF